MKVIKGRVSTDPLENFLVRTITSLAILCIICLTVLKSFAVVSNNAPSPFSGLIAGEAQKQGLNPKTNANEELAGELCPDSNHKDSYTTLKSEWERTSMLATRDNRYQAQFERAQIRMINYLFSQSDYLGSVKSSQALLEWQRAKGGLQSASLARDYNNLALFLQLAASTMPTNSVPQRKSREAYLNSAIQYYEAASLLYERMGKHRSAEVIVKLNEYLALKESGQEEQAKKILKQARKLNLDVGYSLSPPMYFD